MDRSILKFAPAVLRGAEQVDLRSRAAQRTYRIYVSTPRLPPPQGGYPVVCVLDADAFFPTVLAQAALRELEGQAILVVGVGYPDADPVSGLSRRLQDFTLGPSASAGELLPAPMAQAAEFGGAPEFLTFLVDELRALIADRRPIDPARQSLLGFSLGGLFALHAMFMRPDAFEAVLAGSPSIWWNPDHLLGEARALRRSASRPRVLITVGGAEQSPPARLPAEIGPEAITSMIKAARMIDNAKMLAEALGAFDDAQPGSHFRLFPSETHGTVIPAALSAGLAFAVDE